MCICLAEQFDNRNLSGWMKTKSGSEQLERKGNITLKQEIFTSVQNRNPNSETYQVKHARLFSVFYLHRLSCHHHQCDSVVLNHQCDSAVLNLQCGSVIILNHQCDRFESPVWHCCRLESPVWQCHRLQSPVWEFYLPSWFTSVRVSLS